MLFNKIIKTNTGASPTRSKQLSNLCPRRSYFAPKFPRDPKFSKVSNEHIEYFNKILTPSGVIYAATDADAVSAHNTDWMRKFKGEGSLVLRPKTTQQVSSILKYCNEQRLAVVPQGGNSGLVGGSVPVFDEVVLSTSLMNNITNFDPVAGIVTCQAGVVLQRLEEYLNERDHTVPLDLAAKGSCQIGGNISTNAGGVRLLRYGSLHGTVLGVEAVLADGTIIDALTSLRKDNTGYDIKQLFIGSEGTLGVITAATILCPPKPKAVQVAFLACNSFEQVCATFVQGKKDLGEIISAVEFLDRPAMNLVLKHQGARDPFNEEYPYYVLIETSGSNKEHDEAKLLSFLDKVMNSTSATIANGTIAYDEKQKAALWKLRESISESLQREGTVYKYDISLPLNSFYDIVADMRQRIKDKGTVVGYGHIGDGNLHLNIATPKFNKEVFDLIEPYVYEWTGSKRGSISAEHGIGVAKPEYLHFSKSPASIKMMQQLKQTFDPNGILNPYKVIPV